MSSKSFRISKDSLKALSLSIALFVKLLTKTCEVVQSSSSAGLPGKRPANTLDICHLAHALKRYEVLTFLKDLIDEMKPKSDESVSIESVEKVIVDTDAAVAKRKSLMRSEAGDCEARKKIKGAQSSITSFFKQTVV